MTSDSWNALEARHLVTLRAVAEHGSFSQAALALGYSQSAVSQQMTVLERIVGAALFDRLGGRRAVALTAHGELLARHAEVLLARVQAAQADFRALDAGPQGPLTVGLYQSVGARLLPHLIAEFAALQPGVELRLREASNDVEAWRLVTTAAADLTFSMLPLDEEVLEAAEVLADPYVLVVPPDSDLAGDRALTARRIAAHPLVGFGSCRNESNIEAQLRQAGCEPNIVFRSDDNTTIQALVASGYGIALLPRLAVDLSDPAVLVIDVGHLFRPRLLGICWHRDRQPSPAARDFVELARRRSPEIAAHHADARQPASVSPSSAATARRRA